MLFRKKPDVKRYKPYTGRNPKTGNKIKIKTKKPPFFKSGKELKQRVDYQEAIKAVAKKIAQLSAAETVLTIINLQKYI